MNGFVKLGEALLGGGVDREGAYLDGRNVGSQINERNARTQNALAQAESRIQQNEAAAGLREMAPDLGIDPALVEVMIANLGSDFNQVTQGRGNLQEQDFRSILADPNADVAARQGAGLGIRGTPVTQGDVFGPGGELILPDLFDGTFDPNVTATGRAQIGADEALATDRLASAALDDEKRTNPAAFRNAPVTVQVGPDGKGLGDTILEDIGDSTIPEDIDPSSATGVVGAGKSIANSVFDVANVNLPFPDADRAQNAMTDLHRRTMIVGQQSVPGRPSNYLMQQLASFGVEPNDIFRSDQRSLSRMQQTSSFLGGEIDRLRRTINGGRLTAGKMVQYETALRDLAALKQDYDVVISRFDNSQFGGDGATGEDTWTTTESGVRFRKKGT